MILVVILGDTEAGKQAHDHQAPYQFILLCVGTWVVVLIHLTWVWSDSVTVSKSSWQGPHFLLLGHPSVNPTVAMPMAPGTDEFPELRPMRTELASGSAGLLPSSLRDLWRSPNTHLSIFPATVQLLAYNQPLLRGWNLLTPADQSVLRNMANWWLHFIFRMLSRCADWKWKCPEVTHTV